jgi:tRNA uridine 5-carbamoylmethylation protein Kti12
MSVTQYIEDTKYMRWEDGMYVMLDDLADPLDEQEYVLALVEDSLRRSRYFRSIKYFYMSKSLENKMGITCGIAGYWLSDFGVKLTRAQALYIATGDTDI